LIVICGPTVAVVAAAIVDAAAAANITITII
jgi:hypothetical protein